MMEKGPSLSDDDLAPVQRRRPWNGAFSVGLRAREKKASASRAAFRTAGTL